MQIEDLIIPNVLGLHARAAAKLNRIACCCNASIKVKKGEKEVDARNIMALLMLGATKGTPVTIRIEGDEELRAMNEVKDLFARKFDEE